MLAFQLHPRLDAAVRDFVEKVRGSRGRAKVAIGTFQLHEIRERSSS